MPNPYFHFKQFTIFHDKCAMKVGTDGVLLGAWTNTENAGSILDIGTGTGLIALMLAQKCLATIDAVEIDENACIQAAENIANCPWKNRITLVKSSIQEYSEDCGKKNDLIVSNPPFFQNAFLPENRSRVMARHNNSLQLDELISCSQILLNNKGKLSVIIPFDLFVYCQRLLNDRLLHMHRILYIKPVPAKGIIRVMIEAGFEKRAIAEQTLVIEKGGRHDYTQEYIELTKDYYLAF